MTSRSGEKRKKKGGKEGGRGRGHLELWHLSSHVPIRHDGAWLSWGWLHTCLPWEVVNEPPGLLYPLVFISNHEFSHSYPSNSLPILLGGQQVSSYVLPKGDISILDSVFRRGLLTDTSEQAKAYIQPYLVMQVKIIVPEDCDVIPHLLSRHSAFKKRR